MLPLMHYFKVSGGEERKYWETNIDPIANNPTTENLVLRSIFAFQTKETGSKASIQSVATFMEKDIYVGIVASADLWHSPPASSGGNNEAYRNQ